MFFFSQGNVIKQISESVFPLLSFFFFWTDCEAAVCSGGVFLVVMFQHVFWIECLFPNVEIYCVPIQGQHLQDGVIPWWGE